MVDTTSPRSVVLPERARVEDCVGEQIQVWDPQQLLRSGDFQDVLEEVTDNVVKMCAQDGRTELNDEDRSFIQRHVGRMVYCFFDEYKKSVRRRIAAGLSSAKVSKLASTCSLPACPTKPRHWPMAEGCSLSAEKNARRSLTLRG